MTDPKEPETYLLYIFDCDVWSSDGPIFKSKEDAHAEIKAMVEIMPVMKGTKYSIVPNDGICQGAYRPLDYGDRIFTGKPRGVMQEVFVA